MQTIEPGSKTDWAISIFVVLTCVIGFFVVGYYALHS